MSVIALVVVLQILGLRGAAVKHPRAQRTALALPPVTPRKWKGVTQPLGIPGNWKFALDDEFSGGQLNQAIWRPGWYGTGITGAPNTLEDDCYSSANVKVAGDGTMQLAVTATRSKCHGVTYPYTGALVSTNPHDGRRSGGFVYTYGVLEARVYVPGKQTWLFDWPAIWTDGFHWPVDGEDDVMEAIGGNACFHFHSLHYARHGPGACVILRPGWHTFASDWSPGSVSYYYDGHRVATITHGITDKPMFIVIDNTVWRTERALTHPAVMRVDYVRVWQRVG